MEQKMFCYQCQETAGCKGCTACGVCGKTPEVAAMQDLLVYVTKGLSAVTTQLRKEGQTVDKSLNHLISVNLFSTITNANFDNESIIARIRETLAVKEELLAKVQNKDNLPEAALWNGSDFEEKAKTVGVLATENEEIRSLREMGNRLDIAKVHPHKFRRTLATMAIDKGMPIEQLQQLLGHKRIDTTLQYAMVKQSNVKAAHKKYIG